MDGDLCKIHVVIGSSTRLRTNWQTLHSLSYMPLHIYSLSGIYCCFKFTRSKWYRHNKNGCKIVQLCRQLKKFWVECRKKKKVQSCPYQSKLWTCRCYDGRQFDHRPGYSLNIAMPSCQYRNPTTKIRRSDDSLIFIMGIPIPGKYSLYIQIEHWVRCRLVWRKILFLCRYFVICADLTNATSSNHDVNICQNCQRYLRLYWVL